MTRDHRATLNCGVKSTIRKVFLPTLLRAKSIISEDRNDKEAFSGPKFTYKKYIVQLFLHDKLSLGIIFKKIL